MNARLRILLGLALAAGGMLGACAGDDDDDDDACGGVICPPDGGAGDGDADADADGDADEYVPPCLGLDICDESCGIVGAPCRNDRPCQVEIDGQVLALNCLDEQQYGFPDGYCAGIPSQAQPRPCDPQDDRTCPEDERGICVDDAANNQSLCFRSCEVTDENWNDSNCGCRAGYECDLNNDYCTPGCRTEEPGQGEDCCRTWVDANEDGIATANEFEDIEDCTSTCDASTFRCTNPGLDGSIIGGPCRSNLDCPANGRCLNERGSGDPDEERMVWEGGYCVLDACDLEGRGCTGDSNCVNAGSNDAPFWICLAACTVADDRIADAYADHNPSCRENYGCVGSTELAGNETCETNDDCDDGVSCIGGVCSGNGFCNSLSERLQPHVRLCDVEAFPGTGCPGDDLETEFNEAQRCVDSVCQASCNDDTPCAGDTTCGDDGFCQWSNVGGPCAVQDDDDEWQSNDAACLSPYGQGLCAQGGIFGEAGGCLIASCDSPGMENFCTEGKSCRGIFGGFYCVDECDLPDGDCEGEETCQGTAVGCANGFSCLQLAQNDAQGVCLASCSVDEDPDQFCEDNFGAPFVNCNMNTGSCEQ